MSRSPLKKDSPAVEYPGVVKNNAFFFGRREIILFQMEQKIFKTDKSEQGNNIKPAFGAWHALCL
jgi:hypothetical protein